MNDFELKGKDIKDNLNNLSQLVFEVTDKCNLNCKYCGYGSLYYGYDTRGKEIMSIKKARAIIDYLSKLWCENVEDSLCRPITLSFYGGEPLLGMGFIKSVISYVESLNILNRRFHFSLTTNGLLLNKYMDFLVAKEFNILISLDGNERNHSYRIGPTGKNSHKKVIENIKFLKSSYPDYFDRYVSFNTVLHNRNSVESAYNYILSNFGKKTRISQLNDSNIKKEKLREFKEMFNNADLSIIKSTEPEKLENALFLEAPRTRRLTTFLYRFSGNMYDNYNSLLVDYPDINIKPTGTCIPFSKKMFITVSGKILQCEKISCEFLLGQVTENKVELDFDHIAETFNHYIFKFYNQCVTCSYHKKCSQCVFQNDGLNDKNAHCRSYLSNTISSESLNSNLEYLGKNPNLYSKIMKEVMIRF